MVKIQASDSSVCSIKLPDNYAELLARVSVEGVILIFTGADNGVVVDKEGRAYQGAIPSFVACDLQALGLLEITTFLYGADIYDTTVDGLAWLLENEMINEGVAYGIEG